MGTATLNPDVLVDDLVSTIDELRELGSDFGIRAFHVYTVLRTWAGQMVGDGDYTDVVTELTPRPRVEQWDGYKWVLLAAGSHEDGIIRVTEVSLSNTFAEVAGGSALELEQRNQQFFLRLADAYGQSNEERILRHSRPPFVDREKTMGWVFWLMDMNIPDGSTPALPPGAL